MTENIEGVETPTPLTTHHIGNGFHSPCGLRPADVYHGLQAAFTSAWDGVDCTDCLIKGGRSTDPLPLKNFYLTFGVQYGTEVHPIWTGADGKGWLLIRAEDYQHARQLAVSYLALHWSMLNPEEHFDAADMQARYFPLGTLATITQGQVPAAETGLIQFEASSPDVHGVKHDTIIGCRIEGVLMQGSDADAIEALGYEVELVHTECTTAGRALFALIEEEDHSVMAFEIDYNNLPTCPVCQKVIR